MSRQFRRVKIHVNDVLLPFAILIAVNLVILATWTIVSPLKWNRVYTSSVDVFGRPNESFGSCSYNADTAQKVLFTLLAIVNAVPLGFATYQAYKARRLPPSNFSESFYIAMSLASLLEAFLLATPILILVHDVPSPAFLTKALLVTIVCLAVLLPIFVPKYIRRNERAQEYQMTRAVRTSMYFAEGSDEMSQFGFSRRASQYGLSDRSSLYGGSNSATFVASNRRSQYANDRRRSIG